MGINLQIQQFKEKLANDINEAKLPPTIVQMVLREMTSQVNELVAQAIEAERKEGDKDGKEIRKA